MTEISCVVVLDMHIIYLHGHVCYHYKIRKEFIFTTHTSHGHILKTIYDTCCRLKDIFAGSKDILEGKGHSI